MNCRNQSITSRCFLILLEGFFECDVIDANACKVEEQKCAPSLSSNHLLKDRGRFSPESVANPLLSVHIG